MTGKVKTNARNKFMQKVEAGKLAGRLHRYVMAKESDEDYKDNFMTNAQVAAANILLKKVVPDVKYIEVQDITDYNSDPDSISSRQLAHIASAGSKNVAKAKSSKRLTH